MRHRIFLIVIVLLGLAWLGIEFLNPPIALAQSKKDTDVDRSEISWNGKDQCMSGDADGYRDADFYGSFASQWTGTTNLPVPASSPLSALNGPYCATGRVVADGRGGLTGSLIETYNGTQFQYSFQATYQVHPDGTLTVSGVIDLAPFGKFPLVIYGVLFDNCKQVRATLLGKPVTGLPYFQVAGTAVGTLWKQ
ncbi:MAG: hypothetical protein WBN92_17500 [Terriglobia bacterium]